MKAIGFRGILLCLLWIGSAHATALQAEKDYQVLDVPVATVPTITEYFSFYCPACYRFEGAVKLIQQRFPQAKFDKQHVEFMARTEQEQQLASLALVVAEALKQQHTLTPALFNYIHQQRATLSSVEDVRRLFQLHGVAPEQFDKLAAGFSVQSQLKQMQKAVTHAYQQPAFANRGIPVLVINNKYVLNHHQFSGDAEGLYAAIAELLAKRE